MSSFIRQVELINQRHTCMQIPHQCSSRALKNSTSIRLHIVLRIDNTTDVIKTINCPHYKSGYMQDLCRCVLSNHQRHPENRSDMYQLVLTL